MNPFKCYSFFVMPRRIQFLLGAATMLLLLSMSIFRLAALPESQPPVSSGPPSPWKEIFHYQRYPRSATQPVVYAFEDDDRELCEIHNQPLTRVDLPLNYWESVVEVLWTRPIEGAPHGRLAANAPGIGIQRVRINRCEACTQLTEAFFKITRAEVEEYLRR
jgi:hypothetical protein